MARGLPVFVATLAAAVGIGIAVRFLLLFALSNPAIANAIAFAVGLISFLVLRSYGSLWVSRPQDFCPPPLSASVFERRSYERAEGKLQTAELRMGFVLGGIGAGTAGVANAPVWAILVVGLLLALVGGPIGFDLKRRVLGVRDKLATHREAGISANSGEK